MDSPDLVTTLFGMLPPAWQHTAALTLGVIALINILAGEIVAWTHTPDPSTTWGKIYRGIEFLGRITKKAKEDGVPVIDIAASTTSQPQGGATS
jgi:hypothetical protein